jgi:uncharacterized protein
VSAPPRRALVTGASSGIGRAFAERLARDGWSLRLVARRRALLDAIATDLHTRYGVRVAVHAADLTDPAARRGIERTVARDPHLALLVNDAGMGDFGDFVSRDRDREEAEIMLNVIAVVRLTHAALPGMIRRRRGAVINVSSVAAFQPCPHLATYGGTKAFLNSFTEALQEETRATGVRLQALCPGLTRTEIFDRAGADASDLPSILWMEAESVVDESLAALARGGGICVPGLGNRALSTLTQLLPVDWSARIAGLVMGRVRSGAPAARGTPRAPAKRRR